MLAKSDMPLANDLTVQVVKVFDRLASGEMSTAPRMDIRSLEVVAERIVEGIVARFVNGIGRNGVLRLG